MSRVRPLRPSAGFVVLTGSWVLLASLLAWGSSQPPLERVFEVQQRMQLPTFSALTPEELETLTASFGRHPALVADFIGSRPAGFLETTDGGWLEHSRAHLLIRPNPEAPLRLTFYAAAPAPAYPLSLALVGSGMQERLTLESREPLVLELPRGKFPALTLAEVELHAARTQTGAVPIRLRVIAETLVAEAAP